MTLRSLLGVLLVAALPGVAAAQGRVAGFVLRPSGADATPVPGARVVLHRIGRATQGPIDSVTTAKDGRFDLRFEPDSTANYILSTRYAGIAYFSPPLPPRRVSADTGIKLLVFDTSSTARLVTRSRTLVMSKPDALGARTVVDWFVLSNAGTTTRVGRDTLSPTWIVALPPGVQNAAVGDSRINQISPDAVSFRGDSAFVYAPFSPGDKEVLIQYELPPNETRLTVPTQDADSVDLFLEEASASVSPGTWTSSNQMFEGRSFRRFARKGRFDGPIVVKLPGLGLSPTKALPILIVGFGVVLALWSGWLVRHRRRDTTVVPMSVGETRTPEAIAREVAALDREQAARPGPTSAPEADAYRERRTSLMAELEACLAKGAPRG